MPNSDPATDRITHRACHLCEALCGVEIRTRGDEITSSIQDPFSRGHVCPAYEVLRFPPRPPSSPA
jgi:anaerobic selenocysteine-containing dehydrogenase